MGHVRGAVWGMCGAGTQGLELEKRQGAGSEVQGYSVCHVIKAHTPPTPGRRGEAGKMHISNFMLQTCDLRSPTVARRIRETSRPSAVAANAPVWD